MNVRPCDEKQNRTKQAWFHDSFGQLRLRKKPFLCMRWKGKKLRLGICDVEGSTSVKAQFVYNSIEKSWAARKPNGRFFYVGVPSNRRKSARLFKNKRKKKTRCVTSWSIVLHGSNVASEALSSRDMPSLTLSTSPNVLPASDPSLSASPSPLEPALQPSLTYEKEFQIRTVFGLFDASMIWCLQADQLIKGVTSKLLVRPCKSFSDGESSLQKWKTDAYDQLFLADPLENHGYCVKSRGRTLYLDNCVSSATAARENNTQFTFHGDTGTISHVKSAVSYLVGFNPTRRFSRLRLFKNGTFNDSSLYTWRVNMDNDPPHGLGNIFQHSRLPPKA